MGRTELGFSGISSHIGHFSPGPKPPYINNRHGMGGGEGDDREVQQQAQREKVEHRKS